MRLKLAFLREGTAATICQAATVQLLVCVAKVVSTGGNGHVKGWCGFAVPPVGGGAEGVVMAGTVARWCVNDRAPASLCQCAALADSVFLVPAGKVVKTGGHVRRWCENLSCSRCLLHPAETGLANRYCAVLSAAAAVVAWSRAAQRQNWRGRGPA